MKTKKIFLFSLIFILIAAHSGICLTGITGAKFITLPMSSRAISLGNAYTAEMDRIDCQYVNDAGIANMKSTEIAIHNTFWMFDMNYNSLGFVTKLPRGTIGASLILFLPGKVIAYDGWGYEKGRLYMSDFSIKASYALSIKKYLFAGAGIKYIRRDLDVITESAVDLDMGITYRSTLSALKFFKICKGIKNNFSAGIAVQNIIGRIGKDKLPSQLRLGISYKIVPFLGLLSDYVFKFYDADQFNSGLEYVYNDMYFLRAGYILGDKNYLFTSGMGIKFKIKNALYTVDYSYSPLAFDYNVHSLNFAIKFVSFDIQYDTKEKLMKMYIKGGTYYLQREYDKAVKEWKKILEIDPDYPGVKEKIREIEEIQKIKEGINEK